MSRLVSVHCVLIVLRLRYASRTGLRETRSLADPEDSDKEKVALVLSVFITTCLRTRPKPTLIFRSGSTGVAGDGFRRCRERMGHICLACFRLAGVILPYEDH